MTLGSIHFSIIDNFNIQTTTLSPPALSLIINLKYRHTDTPFLRSLVPTSFVSETNAHEGQHNAKPQIMYVESMYSLNLSTSWSTLVTVHGWVQ